MRNNQTKCLILNKSIKWARYITKGKLLHKVTEKEVVNIARYYYHKTVYIGGKENNIYNNVRKGLDIIRATNYKPKNLIMPPRPARRSSSYTNAPLPPSKLHQHVITRDYRKPLYKASSQAIILTTLKGPSEAQGKTGIRAFIAIRIYIHYNRPNKKGNVNSINIKKLAKIKKGEVNNKGDFLKSTDNNFSPYYQPLIP
ncbi:hypothetical protein V2W45_1471575 [Cenococcum geophilum]